VTGNEERAGEYGLICVLVQTFYHCVTSRLQPEAIAQANADQE
jgi:hypothetical protein